MSTRSGKRIHNSIHENIENIAGSTEAGLIRKPEKKTRSKRLKENIVDENVDEFKKRPNYVTYPGSSENETDIPAVPESQVKSRKSRKHIFKELDSNEVESESQDECKATRKTGRLTRQTKRFNELQDENTELLYVISKNNKKKNVKEMDEIEATINTNKKSKNKKKLLNNTESEILVAAVTVINKKKSKKKKNAKRSSSIAEDTVTDKRNNTLNKSGMSVDSFHSAAGSPVSERDTAPTDKHKPLISKAKSQDIFMSLDGDPEPSLKLRMQRKSSVDTYVPLQNNSLIDKNKTDLQSINVNDDPCNITLVKVKKSFYKATKHRSSIKSEENNDALNTVAQMPGGEIFNGNMNGGSVNKKCKSNIHNVSAVTDVVDNSNSFAHAVEVAMDINPVKIQRRSRRLSHLDPETPDTIRTKSNNKTNKTLSDKKKSILLDVPIENTPPKLDSTFDNQDDNMQKVSINSDATFDKSDEQLSSKSSLLTSDSEMNGTYSKTNDISRISITSDESKTENIINTTPVLIESSLDNTQLEHTPTKPDTMEAATTPLKREGTFTKDSPEDTSMLPKINDNNTSPPKKASIGTPEKNTPLGIPGSTPFPFSKGSQKKSVLNVTHSIEKGAKPSLEYAPRTTRVMFCSPVDCPLPATESKPRIVKSSVKGSNKSFVFDSSVCSRATPPRRKRSSTHEEGIRAKRSRLADDLQQSVERLSRPRTASAAGKLDSTSSASKPGSSRSKLPNFAALHQRQFARMESLDECQRRKARRARQLLVPTGSLAVLERSPRATESPRKSKECKIKKADPPKATKPEQEAKPDEPLPSYTRFGFKMNIPGVENPFSIPPKERSTAIKPKEKKPYGVNTRATLPSLNGGTSVRKDVAKQIIMREKSFTSLSNKRDTKRTQNRTIIKGVRTNRRFELQMQMRNIDG